MNKSIKPLQDAFKHTGSAASLLTLLLATTALINTATAKDFVSQSNATEVIELFTSEGCSSCPPAERWLSGLKNNSDTFKSLIPLAFHVDYWDYIGWKDRFAKPVYSLRQRQYVATGSVSQSYTPQMVANSSEWRGFISGQREWVPNDKNVGVLKASVQDGSDAMFVRFAPTKRNWSTNSDKKHSHYVLNVAILGMGLSSQVTAGENHNRTLNHDFVVLNHQMQQVAANPAQWKIAMPKIPKAGQSKNAVAIWLSEVDSQRIIQATGGYL